MNSDEWREQHENLLALYQAEVARADEMRQRAESAELGCEIAYKREPTQAEGDAHEHRYVQRWGPSFGAGGCYVPMGGWTGRRCRVCRRWVWGGPTACVACVGAEVLACLRDALETVLATDGTAVSHLDPQVRQQAIAALARAKGGA